MRHDTDATLSDPHHHGVERPGEQELGHALATRSGTSRGIAGSVKLCLAVFAAGLATLTAPPPAMAGQPGLAPRSAVVAHGDLDLASTNGRATLAGRVRAAARQVCGLPRLSSAEQTALSRACYRETVARMNNHLQPLFARAEGRADLAAR